MDSPRLARRPAAAAARSRPAPLTRTIERQIEDILTQVAPRRVGDGPTRGVVSVLFVGIRGYVSLCDGLDPLAVGRILDVYLRTVLDSLATYLGSVHATLGDLVMASWNAAFPQADHALLAVSAAMDIVERGEDIDRRLHAAGLPLVRYGIGVNTGDALIRPAGPFRRDGDAVGDMVNVARLLADAAGSGEILIGEGTRVSIGTEFLTEPVEVGRLPGKNSPVRAYRVTGRGFGGEAP